jgi:predicted urease superfamily metal-dependent hydrolase
MADRPHFALPFRWVARGDGTLSAAENEQDTSEEIADAVECAVRTVQGERNAIGEFGRPEVLEFTIDPELARAQLQASLEASEPRAATIVHAEDWDPHDEGAMRLRVMFAHAEGGEG